MILRKVFLIEKAKRLGLCRTDLMGISRGRTPEDSLGERIV
jgi:hypothetical protein